MKQLLMVLSLLLTISYGQAQELNCNINLNSDQVEGSNKSVFVTLKKSITEFVNNRKWTELTYANAERIECTMNIIVKKMDDDVFKVEIQVQ